MRLVRDCLITPVTPMIKTHRPSNSELLEQARQSLRVRGPARAAYCQSFKRASTLQGVPMPRELATHLGSAGYIGPRPPAFIKPSYGTPAYALAVKVGWITAEEEKGDRLEWQQRHQRSLQTAHRYALIDDQPHQKGKPRESGSYVPQLAARLDDDPNLTDGARRCARKIAEITYRRNRVGRSLDVTVPYLMKALGRSRRTVQRYLRVLEREGYIAVQVIGSQLSRMCVGLEITLKRILFARHHREGWPPKAARKPHDSGAAKKSLNDSTNFSLESYKHENRMFSVQSWTEKCFDGVFRSLRRENSSLIAPTAPSMQISPSHP